MSAQVAIANQNDSESSEYVVLARKYRPTALKDLIGQETLTKVLTQGIEGGRLGHAFIMTGIRGTGKTSTARIIARALNCVGADGQQGPTPEPCGVCASCTAIAQDRHMDVIEIDAASRTSVDDIREIIEAARYKPVSSRYKIYIIDEVHMLSKSAFNALLKTLEEPPAHVKFIFATTEIHKVPQTILSRCLRFDLKRIPVDALQNHFAEICSKEGVTYDEDALTLIARAADGSVRDGLSLLDQAITQSHTVGQNPHVETDAVRQMLGLADQGQVFDLTHFIFEGKVQDALKAFRELHHGGADPLRVIEEVLDLVHWLHCLKIYPEMLEDPTRSEHLRAQAEALLPKLPISILARLWQATLKGLHETCMAPNPMQAAEVLLMRLVHLSHLPPLDELLKKFKAHPVSVSSSEDEQKKKS